MPPSTVVSSPGKVLIAGGYLVLDPAYSGTVISTSSRFYTVVRDDECISPNTLQVRSPQFNDAAWNYTVKTDSETVVEPSPENLTKNKFVQLAIEKAIKLGIELRGAAAIQQSVSHGVDIAIVGANDFYSQRATLTSLDLPRTLDSLKKIKPFNSTGVSLSDVHKTGLGSSAALITSLVSALLVHLAVLPASALSEGEGTDDNEKPDIEGRRLAHNLAQYVHCLAQGKVGSGFDVSAAVFGSHLYTRFDPVVLQPIMDDSNKTQVLLSVLSSSNTSWNYGVVPFKLPPLTRIMLADVDAGSDTPSLVGKVLKWRKENSAQADTLWREIDQLNQSLAQTLLHITKLHDQDPAVYGAAVKYISSLQPIQWAANPWQPESEIPIVEAFYEAHHISQVIRAKMREMGKLAGVPIEPPEQTKLLDTCVYQAGIIGGGVPGAGGYDAIWLLVCDPVDCSPDQHPIERIEHVWSNYKDLSVSPLSASESTAGGSRLEKLEDIPGLIDAVSTEA
ncbi:Phosphomevalonate kinase [Macrolepiota fuliginosa MF-IS2]|uniref:Phosphomevalonate kinase n=1 Tax=Macrolepiota fuliginosa MF-IS2 TaxID=1400762 RepID=A0A9P5XJ39_9AGAR|nr:Phosphomevalonate kinase [Macrolepiota fuliginosa MF-IS2]